MLYSDFQGERLSMLGMGAMRLPERFKLIDKVRATQLIDLAYNSGINYFDTAFVYHLGKSEPFLGEALSRYPREKLKIATKYYGAAGISIESMFERQLKRLRTDYIDFYLLHSITDKNVNKYTDSGKRNAEFLMEQKAKGRIRHIGFSSHAGLKTLEDMLEWSDCFEFVQIQLNYLDWTLQNAKAQYELITSHKLPVWVMEPVRGGKLATLNPAAVKLLKSYAPERSAASWAFRWLMGLPNVKVILSGMSDTEQVTENVELFSRSQPLSEHEAKLLANALALYRSDLAVPCTACRYCCESCPRQIEIPRWLNAYNEYEVSKSKDAFTGISSPTPHDCISCRVCENHCPQSIKIPDIMKKISGLQ